MKTKLPSKITIIQDKSLLKDMHRNLENSHYIKDCFTSHIVAVKQKRGYVIVKHIWQKTPIKFKNKSDLMLHLAEYI